MPSRLVKYLVPRPFLPVPPEEATRRITDRTIAVEPANASHTSDILIDVDELGEDTVSCWPNFNINPRLNRSLEHMVSVVGVNAISDRSGVERAYNFSEGTMLGVRFGEKFYDYDDPYVLESEIRRVATGDLITGSSGRKVVWLETVGVVETGYGAQGTVHLGDIASVSGSLTYGFSAGEVLRFRTSQAFALGSNSSTEKLVDEQKFSIPKTAATAKLMPAGSEIEITGQGKVNTDLDFNLRLGPNVAMATAGIALDIASHSNVTGEFSLNVTALDGYRNVRVTIRALDSESTSLSAAFKAGLIFAPGTLQPPWGAGILKYLVAATGYNTVEDLVNAYTALTARYEYAKAHKGTIIASYDFDLNNPAAIPAYEEMIKLSTTRAHLLSRVRSLTGVARVLAKENEVTTSSLFDLTMLGEKLYLRKTLDVERNGSLEEAHKEIMVYRDSIFTKNNASWFTGSRSVDWQAVSVQNIKTEEKKPYFRFHFKKTEYSTNAEKTDDYFRFAYAMGIYASELTENIPAEAGDYEQVFAAADEIETDIDIYFTSAGAKLIDEADMIQAYNAYLAVSSEILPRYKNLPILGTNLLALKSRELIREHESIIKNKRVEYDKKSALERICKEYWSLTQRELSDDAELAREAQDFANSINELVNVADHEQAKKFFIKFGKEKGFNFMQTIAALQRLAQANNTLIHSLTRSGGGITLQSRDEGKLEHPREIVMGVLTSALQ